MRVEGLGFRVQGSGFRVQGSGFRAGGGSLGIGDQKTDSLRIVFLDPAPCASSLEFLNSVTERKGNRFCLTNVA